MKLSLFVIVLLIAGCRSRSLLSDSRDVKVSRTAAPANCQEIGAVTGRVSSAQGTQEQALDDLKKEAANKGANYLVVKQYSAYGTSVTGLAYECP